VLIIPAPGLKKFFARQLDDFARSGTEVSEEMFRMRLFVIRILPCVSGVFCFVIFNFTRNLFVGE
jgi:hypothetical protein